MAGVRARRSGPRCVPERGSAPWPASVWRRRAARGGELSALHDRPVRSYELPDKRPLAVTTLDWKARIRATPSSPFCLKRGGNPVARQRLRPRRSSRTAPRRGPAVAAQTTGVSADRAVPNRGGGQHRSARIAAATVILPPCCPHRQSHRAGTAHASLVTSASSQACGDTGRRTASAPRDRLTSHGPFQSAISPRSRAASFSTALPLRLGRVRWRNA